ncbi:heterokaryon incompatibility protein-domain-containing protein [Pestalotiopsis sp. NC0098]|nr:heterokaryon incompatibility protein-domain-containing protein [Pestalotiopsis sp. NC0098]
MRLLDAESLEVVEVDEVTPPYAILSHRWEDEEISLADLNTPVQNAVLGRRGYLKVKSACEYAQHGHGLRYIWIDTCCIDKSSSAELSEAINSMYRWYEESVVCFAFLSDVSTTEDIAEEESELSKSKWFTRGWTLQELLAPKNVIFLSSSWAELGTRAELSRRLSKITSIGEPYLIGEESLTNASIACRMSWASQRVTKRPEDRAYCLLGIFDVNMPLLYGEGLVKAFRRLQEEILKDTTDESIFAWWQKEKRDAGPFGFLARTPADFAHSADVISWMHPELPSFELSRRAISLRAIDINSQTYVTLRCKFSSDPTKVLAIGSAAASGWNHLFRVSAEHPEVMYSDRIWQARPIFAMKHQPHALSEQSVAFDIMIEQTSELVKLGRPAGSNFTWDPKSRTLRRVASHQPFKVEIPVHVGNIEVDIGLWLLADAKGLFMLDLVALVPPWEAFAFKPGADIGPTGWIWQVSEMSHSSRQVKSIDFERGRHEIPLMTKLGQETPCYILSIVVQCVRSNDCGSQYILYTRLSESRLAELAGLLADT